MPPSRPSSKANSRTNKTSLTTASYERPEAQKVTSKHAGTVLEDGLDANLKAELSQEQYQAGTSAFGDTGEGAPLSLSSVRRALQSLNVNLDDALFQRLVESRWDQYSRGTGADAIDCEGFLHLYSAIWTPATTFGRHLRKAAGRGDEEIVRELILRGCNPNTGSGTGETALHTMAAHGQVECARTLKALCREGLMVQPRDKAGWTPLMVAAGNGHTPFMRFLLEEGADPQTASESGRTAMHRAAARGRENALKTLISKKAPVDCADGCGYTPLHVAAMHDEDGAIRVLLDAGADVQAKDALGYPPRHYCGDRLWQKLMDERGGGGRK